MNKHTAHLEILIRNTIPDTSVMTTADLVKTLVKDLSEIMKDDHFLRNKTLIGDVIDEIKIDPETVTVKWRFPNLESLQLSIYSSGAPQPGEPLF